MSNVDAKRAQVHSVVERQARVKEMYPDGPVTPSAEAELLGAENRVRIEMKRYDEAATAYNTKADGLGSGFATTVLGMPKRVPLSNEAKF
jgi:hypothetical protein